jgi:muramoyltetrapeptide carboxypeptidase
MSVKPKNVRIPPRLVAGDTIGVIAPASPFEHEKFYQGLSVLESMGYTVKVAKDLFQRQGYLAGSDSHRARLLHRFFSDSDVKAIICARGGYGSMRILKRLDYKRISANPKILVGFSDISALLAAIHHKCGVVTFHGPVVTTFGEIDQESKAAFTAVLSTDRTVELISENKITIKSGVADGAVLAGNLTTLCHLTGTPFEPELAGRILVLEDRGEAPYRIDRMLTQMKLAGCFKDIAGLALGAFEKCGDEESIYRIFEEIFADDDVPVLAGVGIGHRPRNLTIPLGIGATLDTDRRRLIFHQPATLL